MNALFTGTLLGNNYSLRMWTEGNLIHNELYVANPIDGIIYSIYRTFPKQYDWSIRQIKNLVLREAREDLS